MARIQIDDEATPTAPAVAKSIVTNDSVAKVLVSRTSVKPQTVGSFRNASTSAQAYTTADVYIAGSALTVPSHLLQVGTTMRWVFGLTKTAGTAGQVFTVRVGTAGSTADTARVTFTQAASGTSVTDTEWVDIQCTVRTAGASGVLTGMLTMSHVLATTGFSTLGANVMSVTSSSFDMTVASLLVGVSFNHSTAGAGNIEYAYGELMG